MPTPTVYPKNLNEAAAMDLDTFLENRPHSAWMYLIHLKTQPGRFLRDLSKKQYFIRKDGLMAVYDPEIAGKSAWDFYDPKQGVWFSNKDLPEPAAVWGEGSPGIFQKRGRKPGWRKNAQQNGSQQAQEVETTMAVPTKRRPGRPKGSKNKPKPAVEAETQLH